MRRAETLGAIHACPVPVIAAVNGAAIGTLRPAERGESLCRLVGEYRPGSHELLPCLWFWRSSVGVREL